MDMNIDTKTNVVMVSGTSSEMIEVLRMYITMQVFAMPLEEPAVVKPKRKYTKRAKK